MWIQYYSQSAQDFVWHEITASDCEMVAGPYVRRIHVLDTVELLMRAGF